MSGAVRQVCELTRRELIGYLVSPIPYVFTVVFLTLAGVMTFVLSEFFERGEANLAPTFFVWLPWLSLGLVPAIGMRLWSEEARSGTMELLLTFPVEPWQPVVAKYLAATVVVWLAIALTFPIPAIAAYLGEPDLGAVASAYLGALLMSAAYLGIASVASACTRSQVVALIVSLVAGLALILIGFEPVTAMLIEQVPDARWLIDAVSSLGLTTHYNGFAHGLVRLSSTFYFCTLVALSLYATCVVLDHRRG